MVGCVCAGQVPDALTTALVGRRSSASPRSDAFRSRLEPLGVTAVATLGGPAFADFQRSEMAKWGKAVHDAGVRID